MADRPGASASPHIPDLNKCGPKTTAVAGHQCRRHRTSHGLAACAAALIANGCHTADQDEARTIANATTNMPRHRLRRPTPRRHTFASPARLCVTVPQQPAHAPRADPQKPPRIAPRMRGEGAAPPPPAPAELFPTEPSSNSEGNGGRRRGEQRWRAGVPSSSPFEGDAGGAGGNESFFVQDQSLEEEVIRGQLNIPGDKCNNLLY